MTRQSKSNLYALDVRPILAQGDDLLETIVSTLDTIRSAGVLTLTASFHSAPLLRLLEEQGHSIVIRELGYQLWCIDIVVDGASRIVELLDLEPPEPLERVLKAIARLAKGETYIARLPQFPRMLIPHLDRYPIKYEIAESIDGSALLHLREQG